MGQRGADVSQAGRKQDPEGRQSMGGVGTAKDKSWSPLSTLSHLSWEVYRLVCLGAGVGRFWVMV